MPLAIAKVYRRRLRSGQRNHAKGGPFVSAGQTFPDRVLHFRDHPLIGHAADVAKSALINRSRRSGALAITAGGSCRRKLSFRSPDPPSHIAGTGSMCPEGTVSSGSTGSVN